MKKYIGKKSKSAAANNYCCKEETRKPGTSPYWKGWEQKFEPVITEFKQWQTDILNIIKDKCPRNDRKIHWIFDEKVEQEKLPFANM